jgi:hypothetical protein
MVMQEICLIVVVCYSHLVIVSFSVYRCTRMEESDAAQHLEYARLKQRWRRTCQFSLRASAPTLQE